jgi:hypothetical protein
MERETPLSNLRCLAAYPFMGKASGENPEDKSSLGPAKSLLCFQERSNRAIFIRREVSTLSTIFQSIGVGSPALHLPGGSSQGEHHIDWL